jgi:hypothetical protein
VHTNVYPLNQQAGDKISDVHGMGDVASENKIWRCDNEASNFWRHGADGAKGSVELRRINPNTEAGIVTEASCHQWGLAWTYYDIEIETPVEACSLFTQNEDCPSPCTWNDDTCQAVTGNYVDGPRVDSNSYQQCDDWYGSLSDAEAKCNADSTCSVLHDFGCDGQGWRFCGANVLQNTGDSNACTKQKIQAAETPQTCGSEFLGYIKVQMSKCQEGTWMLANSADNVSDALQKCDDLEGCKYSQWDPHEEKQKLYKECLPVDLESPVALDTYERCEALFGPTGAGVGQASTGICDTLRFNGTHLPDATFTSKMYILF